jgi:hypothetical protein
MSFAIIHYPGDGTLGMSASHAGENLMMAWPPDRADSPALLPLHVLDGAGLLTRFSPEGPLPGVCSTRNLRSCEAEPPVEVAGTTT